MARPSHRVKSNGAGRVCSTRPPAFNAGTGMTARGGFKNSFESIRPDPRTVVFHLVPTQFHVPGTDGEFSNAFRHHPPASVDASGRWLQAIGTGPYEIPGMEARAICSIKALLKAIGRDMRPRLAMAAQNPLRPLAEMGGHSRSRRRRAALLSGQIDLITAVRPADLNEIGGRRAGDGLTVPPAWTGMAILLNGADPLLRISASARRSPIAIDFSALAARPERKGQDGPTPPCSFARPLSFYRGGPSAIVTTRHGRRRLFATGRISRAAEILQANRRYQAMFDNAHRSCKVCCAVPDVNIQLDVAGMGNPARQCSRRADFQLMSFGYHRPRRSGIRLCRFSGRENRQSLDAVGMISRPRR